MCRADSGALCFVKKYRTYVCPVVPENQRKIFTQKQICNLRSITQHVASTGQYSGTNPFYDMQRCELDGQYRRNEKTESGIGNLLRPKSTYLPKQEHEVVSDKVYKYILI